jgi:hypothetical protein
MNASTLLTIVLRLEYVHLLILALLERSTKKSTIRLDEIAECGDED